MYVYAYFQSKILAEQQAGKKTTTTATTAAAAAATTEPERDRSPIRGNRAPLLPDPVPGSFAQTRPKRRALLPTPSGGMEDAAPAANPPEGVDPVARYPRGGYHHQDRWVCEGLYVLTVLFTVGLTQSTISRCTSISSTSTSSSTNTSSMPTPTRLHPHRRHHPQPLRRRTPLTRHPQGRTRHPQPTIRRRPIHRRGRTTLRRVTITRREATALHLGTMMSHQEAMMHLEATEQREHMIHLELTQQGEATPHPHRMSRHPHTGNPCPSAMITLTTHQSPHIDSRTQGRLSTLQTCVQMCIYIRDT